MELPRKKFPPLKKQNKTLCSFLEKVLRNSSFGGCEVTWGTGFVGNIVGESPQTGARMRLRAGSWLAGRMRIGAADIVGLSRPWANPRVGRGQMGSEG